MFATHYIFKIIPPILLSVTGIAQTTYAQSADVASNARTYSPKYFETYAPQTALDMVERIPGFEINVADEKRGLGQGGANILINGKRLTGKTDPEQQLARISANSVTNIKVVDGASLSIAGLSGQVVNIQTKVSGISGNWRWSPEFKSGIEPDWFNGEISLTGSTGHIDYAFKLKNNSRRVWKNGPEILKNQSGNVFETRGELIKEFYDRPSIGIDLTYKPRPEHIMNLNAEYEVFNYTGIGLSDQLAVTSPGQTLSTRLDVNGEQWSSQIGADYEFPLGAGSIKFIGLQELEHSNPKRQFDTVDVAGLLSRLQFPQTSDKSETIFRAEYSLPVGSKQSWQAAIEGAFNDLDVENQFLFAGRDGVLVEGALNNFKVGEDRAEVTLTYSRQFSPALNMQMSLGGEYSVLEQERDGFTVNESRKFFRPKGFISTTYKSSPTLDIRTRFEREVGQLNFFDFVSSTNLQDDLDVTANPDLVPEQNWLGNVEFDKNLGQGNRFKVKFYGEAISDIVDRIPIGANGEGVGNLDQAYKYGVDIASTFKGEQWGWAGTQLDLRLDLRKSSLKDPLLGFSRRINSDKKAFYSASFRHDIKDTDWAYGFSADRFFRALDYRTFSFSDSHFTTPYVLAFVEHKNIAGLKLRLTASNLTNRGEFLQRTFYDNRRDTGEINKIEQRTRTLKPFLHIDLSGQF